MDIYDKDIILSYVLDLDLKSIYQLCKSSKKFNNAICNSNIFWRKKLEKDYPNVNISNVSDVKNLYKYLKVKAPIHEIHASDYIYEYDYESYDFIEYIQEELIKNEGVEKGDVVIFEEFPYRRYLWDGKNFLIDNNDDGFFVTDAFSFPETPPNYWENIIVNGQLSVPSYIITEAIKNGSKYITGKFKERYLIEMHHMDEKEERLKIMENELVYADFEDYIAFLI